MPEAQCGSDGTQFCRHKRIVDALALSPQASPGCARVKRNLGRPQPTGGADISHQVTLPTGFRVGYQPHHSLSLSTRNKPRPPSASSAGKSFSTTRATGGWRLPSHTSIGRRARFADRRTFTGMSLPVAGAACTALVTSSESSSSAVSDILGRSDSQTPGVRATERKALRRETRRVPGRSATATHGNLGLAAGHVHLAEGKARADRSARAGPAGQHLTAAVDGGADVRALERLDAEPVGDRPPP